MGEHLVKLKAAIGHGGWLKYVKANLVFSDRTAQRYMDLAKNKEKVMAKFDNVSDLNLSDAYRVAAGRQDPPQPQGTSTEGRSTVPGAVVGRRCGILGYRLFPGIKS